MTCSNAEYSSLKLQYTVVLSYVVDCQDDIKMAWNNNRRTIEKSIGRFPLEVFPWSYYIHLIIVDIPVPVLQANTVKTDKNRS
jgi:hypothetical protein